MQLLLFTLVVALLFLGAVLAVPVVIEFNIRKDVAFAGTMEIRWLFGLLRVPIPFTKTPRSVTQPPSAFSQSHQARNTPDRKARRSKSSAMTKALGSRRFRYRVYRLIRNLLDTVHISRFFLRLELGLDDPADTGRLWALLGPMAGVLGTLRRATVHIAPNFSSTIFALESHGRVQLVPLQLVYVIVGFLLSPVTLRALFNMGK